MNASNMPLKDFFYTSTPAEPFCLGHIRIDFGKAGDEYWAKFFEHKYFDRLYNPELLTEINTELRRLYDLGMTRHLQGMSAFCRSNPEAVIGTLYDGWTKEYGFHTETEHLSFYIRCRPIRDDYQAYIYIYTINFEDIINDQKT